MCALDFDLAFGFSLFFMINLWRWEVRDFMRDRERVFELRKNLIDDYKLCKCNKKKLKYIYCG